MIEGMLFLIGGAAYTGIELLWRGYTHWTMFVLGGACFMVMGILNEYTFPWEISLLKQSLISAVMITIFEFITGCIVNLWLKWNVWDYSGLPFNLFGQVCFYYFLLWIPLSAVGIILDDWIRYILYIVLNKYFQWMKERERPHYILFRT